MIVDEASARAWVRARDDCDPVAEARLEAFILQLTAENRRQNLVSNDSLAHVWRRHIADSAQLLDHVPRGTSPWLDLGSGAGFPGLVVAILRPEARVILTESRPRRREWLQRARDALGLGGVEIATGRIEASPSLRAAAISARAFAPLAKLLAISARFSTPETIWTLPKGRSAREELTRLRGWTHMFHVEHSITDAGSAIIVGRLGGGPGDKRA